MTDRTLRRILDLAMDGLCIAAYLPDKRCPYQEDDNKCGLCYTKYLESLGYRDTRGTSRRCTG